MGRSRTSIDKRLLITLPLLSKLVHVLPIICTNLYESKLFQAHDIKLTCSQIIIHLHHSKTDQVSQGTKIKIPKANGTLCPLFYMFEFFKSRPKFDGHLFCHFDTKPLTKCQFTSVLNKCLRQLGVESRY
ncbi:uncharacterized protein LOC126824343 [Patella vulgata]|uniref:uncharacterized protein LOC126824343 n=1 Tax=Patella vulgata TaxID=6465 RepID=UPI0024A83D21|nr:uncharacterized protein LOC126824343 [Patella vulgata]